MASKIDEANRAKQVAEEKFTASDFKGAKEFAVKAQSMYPELEGLAQLLATLDVHLLAENKVDGEADWYGILGVDPSADDMSVKKQYKKMALVLHPDKNKSVGADGAFKLISEAWDFLSDKIKRISYDLKRFPKTSRNEVPPASGGSSVPSDAKGNASNSSSNARRDHKTSSKAGTVPASGGSSVPPDAKGNASKSSSNARRDHKTSSKAGTNPASGGSSVPPDAKGNASKSSSNTRDHKTSSKAGTAHGPSHPSTPNTFWTVCSHCKMQYDYDRVYLNLKILCDNCHEAFVATEVASASNASNSSTHGSFSQQNQKSNHRSTSKKAHASTTSTSAASNMGSSFTSDSFSNNLRTVCNYCKKQHGYLRKHNLLCTICNEPFVAIETVIPASNSSSHSSTRGSYSQQHQNSNYHYTGESAHASAASNASHSSPRNSYSKQHKNSNHDYTSENVHASGMDAQGKFSDRFWTVCSHCHVQHLYSWGYLNCKVHCSNCNDPFVAVETSASASNTSHSSTRRSYSQQHQNSNHHYTRKNAHVSASNTGTASNMGSSAFSGDEFSNPFWTVCSHCNMQYMYSRAYLNRNIPCSNCHKLYVAVNLFASATNASNSSIPRSYSQRHKNTNHHSGSKNFHASKTNTGAAPNMGSSVFTGLTVCNRCKLQHGYLWVHNLICSNCHEPFQAKETVDTKSNGFYSSTSSFSQQQYQNSHHQSARKHS